MQNQAESYLNFELTGNFSLSNSSKSPVSVFPLDISCFIAL